MLVVVRSSKFSHPLPNFNQTPFSKGNPAWQTAGSPRPSPDKRHFLLNTLAAQHYILTEELKGF
jgi:hypothetical protein